MGSALDPYISNKAVLYYLLPLPFVGFIATVIPSGHWKISLAAVAAWYICGFMIFVSRAVRWNLDAHALKILSDERLDSTNRLASALADVHRENPDYFSIVDWTEVIKTDRTGDISLTRTVKIKVGPKPLNVFWTSLDRSDSSATRDEIAVSVHQVHAESSENTLGFDATWENKDGKLTSRVYVYTNRPMPPNEEFTIRVRWRWPRYMEQLLHGAGFEDFNYNLTRNCSQLSLDVNLPKTKGHSIAIHAGAGTKSEVVPSKRVEHIRLTATGLQPKGCLSAQLQMTKQKG